METVVLNHGMERLKEIDEMFMGKVKTLPLTNHQIKEELKKKFPKLQVFAVDPELSPIISGGQPGPHPIQGIGANFIPKNLHKEVLDGVIQIGKDEAYEYARKMASIEGVFVGGWSRKASTGLVGIARKDGTNGARAIAMYLQTLPVKNPLPIEAVHDFIHKLDKPVVTQPDLVRLQEIEAQEARHREVHEYKFGSNEEMLAALGMEEKISSEQ